MTTTAYVRTRPSEFTPAQIGQAIGCSRQRVIAMIERGELAGRRTPGGHWRIPASEVVGLENALEGRIPVVNVDALA